MKIRKLHIKNYKVFNDLELDFTDANGNTLDKIVLAGVNGCGKTTILEIIRKMYDGSLFDYFKKDDKGFIEIEVELTLEEKDRGTAILPNYIRDLDPNMFGKDLLFFNKKLFSEGNYIKMRFDSTSNAVNEAELIFVLSLGLFSKGKSTLLYLPIKDIKNKNSKKYPYEIIHLSSLENEMKELALKGIRDEIFKNRSVPPEESIEKEIKQITKALNGLNLTTKLIDLESEELIFQSANGQKIKFEDLSNGEQNLYFRAIYLSKLNPKNSIIMVDEPEDSLHPTWQQKVVQLYQNIGENNQVIVATHSPHIIGASKAEEVFLLEINENQVEVMHPRYTKGHSIKHILNVMGANPNDIEVINKVDAYMALVRKGEHETKAGLQLKAEIDTLNLDPNSEEMRRLDLSIKRFKAVGV